MTLATAGTALLPLLFCGGGMALCMYLMNRGMKDKQPTSRDNTSTAGDKQASASDIAELREEVNRLRAELRLRDERQAGEERTG